MPEPPIPPTLVLGRRFLPWDRSPAQVITDDLGFFQDAFHEAARVPALDVDQILKHNAVLIMGEPWTGKTTLAQCMAAYLESSDSANPQGTSHCVHLTALETYIPGASLLPHWWYEWKRGNGTAYWIVDALDEGEHRQRGLWSALAADVRALDESQRSRLRWILFGRTNELPPAVQEDLTEIFEQQHRQVEILPLDRTSGMALVGEEQFPLVAEIIQRCHLQALAGYPVVLRLLKRQAPGVSLTPAKVWERVVSELAEPPRTRGEHAVEIEERLDTAAYLAAVLTLSGISEIAHDSLDPARASLADLVPNVRPAPGEPSRPAARDVFKSSMFHTTPTGVRFIHRNVQERMAVRALSSLTGTRLQPLILFPGVARGERELLRLLASSSNDETIRQRLGSQLLNGAIARLDRLEELASESDYAFFTLTPERLSHLNEPGIGKELGRRIAEQGRPAAARHLLVRIVSSLGAEEAAPQICKIVMDESESIDLRVSCAYALSSAGAPEVLERLTPFLTSSQPQGPRDRELVAAAIMALVRREVWRPVAAFRWMPNETRDDVIDAAAVLPRVILNRLTFDQALEIIRDLSPEQAKELRGDARAGRSPHRDEPPRSEVYEGALQTVATTKEPGTQVLEELIPFCLALTDDRHNSAFYSALIRAFSKNQSARRRLALAAWQKAASKEFAEASEWVSVLVADDVEWLLELLGSLSAENSAPALRLLQLSEDGSLDQVLRARVREAIGQRWPGLLASWDEGRRQREQWRLQSEERQSLRKASTRGIEEVVAEILTHEDLDLHARMVQLGRVVFFEHDLRRDQIVGDWGDLSTELKARVLDVCEVALDTVEPTPLPQQNGQISGRGLFEAWTFRALLRLRPQTFTLTEERIRRWLPAVLRGVAQDRAELLQECYEIAPEVTETLVLSEARLEVDNSHYSVLIQDMPQPLWTPRISHWVADVVSQTDRPAEERGRMLRLLAGRSGAAGTDKSRELLEKELGGFSATEDPLLLTALDVLLATAPEEAWARVREHIASSQGSVLHHLKYLAVNVEPFGYLGGLRVPLESWPNERLAELVEVTLRWFPIDSRDDADGDDEPSDDEELEHWLRRLSWHVFHLLYNRGTPESERILSGLAERQPTIHRWRAATLAEREVRDLLDPSDEQGLEDDYPPWPAVVKALMQARHRMIRDDDDLLEVLVEELELLHKSAANHLDLFYRPAELSEPPQPRHERALQQYVLCRLQDRLPDVVLHRETEVKKGRKTDLLVLSRAANGGFAEVVIETKWSNHRELAKSLEEQLGLKYLVEEGKTHGVYLVGWWGRLSWRGVPDSRRPENDPRSIRRSLELRAERFMMKHPGYRIRVIVLDLSRASTLRGPTIDRARAVIID